VLLDEVEKAHPDVQHSLQVLDDGRITDSKGEPDFRNTVIVMTSIGSEHILDVSGDDSKYEVMRSSAGGVARTCPEFLNRVDDIILFHTSAVANCVKSSFKSSGCKLLADQKLL